MKFSGKTEDGTSNKPLNFGRKLLPCRSFALSECTLRAKICTLRVLLVINIIIVIIIITISNCSSSSSSIIIIITIIIVITITTIYYHHDYQYLPLTNQFSLLLSVSRILYLYDLQTYYFDFDCQLLYSNSPSFAANSQPQHL